MGKFSRVAGVVASPSPVRTVSAEPDTVTAEGAPGWSRDPKSELFLLAVTNMVGEDTFYEKGQDRDNRFESLVDHVTREDPQWVADLVPFLRNRVNLRSASIVAAATYVSAGGPKGRAVVASALQRADEPGEMLAYWTTRHGRNIPKPVKRGTADAVKRLYTERAAMKYDGTEQKWRMADVIDLVHPEPVAAWQGALFKYLLDKRHGHGADLTLLPMLQEAAQLDAIEPDGRRAILDNPGRLAVAGFTWERLASWLQGPMDKAAWEAIIPSMGYMALLRNLRNFDEAGISDDHRAMVVRKLTDPDEVKGSRQLPLRFYSAWKNTQSMHWGGTVERALDLSLANVPSLSGRTLILIDVSGSMDAPMSAKSTAKRWEMAALFGAALARRCESADVYAYSDVLIPFDVRQHSSVLRTVDAMGTVVHGGTQTWRCLQESYKGHDRVVILTDEQAHPYYTGGSTWPTLTTSRPVEILPKGKRLYTFNLAGYKVAQMQSDADHVTFGGLSDAAFDALALLEANRTTGWTEILR